jgi:hypothetical protein
LITENVPQFCPITNHYHCSDDTWLLVTVASWNLGDPMEFFGIPVPIAHIQLPTAVDIFLSDENQNVLDADGDPANGMTPLASFEVDTHEAALAALGYEVTP